MVSDFFVPSEPINFYDYEFLGLGLSGMQIYVRYQTWFQDKIDYIYQFLGSNQWTRQIFGAREEGIETRFLLSESQSDQALYYLESVGSDTFLDYVLSVWLEYLGFSETATKNSLINLLPVLGNFLKLLAEDPVLKIDKNPDSPSYGMARWSDMSGEYGVSDVIYDAYRLVAGQILIKALTGQIDSKVWFSQDGKFAYSRYPKSGFFKSKYPDKYGKPCYYRKLMGNEVFEHEPMVDTPLAQRAGYDPEGVILAGQSLPTYVRDPLAILSNYELYGLTDEEFASLTMEEREALSRMTNAERESFKSSNIADSVGGQSDIIDSQTAETIDLQNLVMSSLPEDQKNWVYQNLLNEDFKMQFFDWYYTQCQYQKIPLGQWSIIDAHQYFIMNIYG